MSCDVSRLRYRGGSVLVPALPICPASRFPHLVISCCLLGLPMPSTPVVPSSSHRRFVISSRPSSRHPIPSVGCLLTSSALPRQSSHHLWQFCLLAARRLAHRPALRPAFRLAPRPVLPWVMSSPPCPIALPCRSACGHRSPRPACRLGWERDGTGRISRHRLPALPPLLALDGVSPACVSSLRSALLALVPPFVSVL